MAVSSVVAASRLAKLSSPSCSMRRSILAVSAGWPGSPLSVPAWAARIMARAGPMIAHVRIRPAFNWPVAWARQHGEWIALIRLGSIKKRARGIRLDLLARRSRWNEGFCFSAIHRRRPGLQVHLDFHSLHLQD